MVVCSHILYNETTSNTPKLGRFQFMCKLVEELCDTNVADALIPRAIPSEHRIIQLCDKKERDCVVCSDRTVTGGGKTKAYTVCKM